MVTEPKAKDGYGADGSAIRGGSIPHARDEI